MPDINGDFPAFPHGRILTPIPRNIPLRVVKANLRAGQPVFVILEPGDMTRYDLVLGYMQGYGYYVVRLEHGADFPKAVYLCENYDPSELAPLTNGNTHTGWVLDWWLRGVLGMKPWEDGR